MDTRMRLTVNTEPGWMHSRWVLEKSMLMIFYFSMGVSYAMRPLPWRRAAGGEQLEREV